VAGNTLELNCTISGFSHNVTSDLIYFMPERPGELGGQRVDVVDRVTSRLRFPGVQRAENLGHVFCYVGDYDEYDHVSFRVAGEWTHYNVDVVAKGLMAIWSNVALWHIQAFKFTGFGLELGLGLRLNIEYAKSHIRQECRSDWLTDE